MIRYCVIKMCGFVFKNIYLFIYLLNVWFFFFFYEINCNKISYKNVDNTPHFRNVTLPFRIHKTEKSLTLSPTFYFFLLGERYLPPDIFIVIFVFNTPTSIVVHHKLDIFCKSVESVFSHFFFSDL